MMFAVAVVVACYSVIFVFGWVVVCGCKKNIKNKK